MNKDNAKDYLPLVKAMSDGKTIQMQSGKAFWFDCYDLCLDLPASQYRIKPQEPEPEKWVACGKSYVDGTLNRECTRPKGHRGFCGGYYEPPTSPTCVHCGKDPNVKSRDELDGEAFRQWLKNYTGDWSAGRPVPDDLDLGNAYFAGLNYARKESK